MEDCMNCNLLDRCPILNKSECPFNQLWKIAAQIKQTADETIAELEKFLEIIKSQ